MNGQWNNAFRSRLTAICAFIFCLALIRQAHAHGELEIRIRAATSQIEAATNNLAQLYLARGELHREHLDWAAATADYDRAAQFDPKLVAVDLARAKMFSDSGQGAEAERRFTEIITRDPKNGEAFVGRARVFLKLQQDDDAIADFQRGLDILAQPQPEDFLECAQAQVRKGQTAEAIQTLDRGIKRFGPLVSLQQYASSLERDRKNYNAAVARLDTIIKLADRKEDWYAQRGEIQLLAGQPADAKKIIF